VSEKYFFDTSAFLSIVKNEPLGINVSSLSDSLNRAQCYTSVLVVYELFRGIPKAASKRKSQIKVIESLLEKFTQKSVFHAQAMTAARIFQYSKGAIDPILAAQCIDGGYTMVTANLQDFERVPGLKIAQL